jgi:hypothetical protein
VMRADKRRRKCQHRPDSSTSVRISGLPAVSALFAVSPAQVEQLLCDGRMSSRLDDLRARAHAQARRQVGADELERVAEPCRGGVVALAQRRPVPLLDPRTAKGWANNGRQLLLDGAGTLAGCGGLRSFVVGPPDMLDTEFGPSRNSFESIEDACLSHWEASAIQGGVSTRTYWAAHVLAVRGHEVHVVTNAKEVRQPFRMHTREEDGGAARQAIAKAPSRFTGPIRMMAGAIRWSSKPLLREFLT